MMLRLVEPRGQPAVSTFALVAVGAVVVGCCVGCAALAAHFSGFPLLVFGGCACVLAISAGAALVVFPRRRDGTDHTSPASIDPAPPKRRRHPVLTGRVKEGEEDGRTRR